MRETRFVSFNFGESGFGQAREILLRCGLAGTAELETEWPLRGYGSVTIEVSDPRLELLLGELRKAGQDPRPRADRVYTKRELDSFPWLTMIVATAGLSGGVNFGQPYDLAEACPNCGAGATPILPLIADLSRMGKKHIDATAHEGFLVVDGLLRSAIMEAGLSGVDFLPVRRPSQKNPDSEYSWMRIAFEWPSLEPDSAFEVEDLCPTCHRSGHFDSWQRVTELHFACVPMHPKDFGYTWEYFGVWKKARVGGSRKVILSQAARQCLLAHRVRRVQYQPVWVHDRGDAKKLGSKERDSQLTGPR